MLDPAISRIKAAMKAAAKANGTVGPAKTRTSAKVAVGSATPFNALRMMDPLSALGFRDRILLDDRGHGKPILLRAWHQAAAALAGGFTVVCLVVTSVLSVSHHNGLVLAEVKNRNADLRVALELMSDQVQSQQAALFDRAAMERGLVLIDSREIDIDTLMAENERLLSTLNTALSLTAAPLDDTVRRDSSAAEALIPAVEESNADVRLLISRLELNKTRTDLLNAELEIERETIGKLADELTGSRQERRALEREILQLNNGISSRDDTIALLKRDVISLQTGQTDSDAARRRAVQLLNEENTSLTAEINDVRVQIDQRTHQLKSLEARLAQSEADTTRLNSLLVQREEQIASLTDAQSLILDRLETKVKEKMASVDRAIDTTGIDHDITVNLDAILESASSPFWNGMGGSIGEVGVEVEEFAVSTDGTTSRINSMFDRALEIERLTEELELKQHHFEQLPTYLPVSGLRLSSGFGMRKHPISGKYRMHKGLDFAGPSGTRVSAAGPGTVSYAARKGSYGNLVEIDHGNGIVTRYAHLRKISVKKGESLIAGEKVGEVGSTGASTGPHLHWEVRVLDKARDPQTFINARKNLF